MALLWFIKVNRVDSTHLDLCQLELQMFHLLHQLLLLLLQRRSLSSARTSSCPHSSRTGPSCHLILSQHRQLAPLARSLCCCCGFELLAGLMQRLFCSSQRLFHFVEACGSLLC